MNIVYIADTILDSVGKILTKTNDDLAFNNSRHQGKYINQTLTKIFIKHWQKRIFTNCGNFYESLQ